MLVSGHFFQPRKERKRSGERGIDKKKKKARERKEGEMMAEGQVPLSDCFKRQQVAPTCRPADIVQVPLTDYPLPTVAKHGAPSIIRRLAYA